MKISIVTISYNQCEFLEACINSILDQDYKDIDFIVVDAGSTDGSREIISKYTNRIERVVLEPDNGPADGLNKGFNYATGDVFCYINADDILLPGALSKAAEIFMQKPAMDVLFGNGYQLDRTGGKVRKLFSSRWSIKAYAYGAANIIQQATFFRRKAFDKAGGFNTDNRTCWDGELLVDLALTGAHFIRTNEFLGGFRIYEGSITGSGCLIEKYELDCKRIKEKILGRPLNRADTLLCGLYLLGKYINHPYQVFYKLWPL